MLAALLIKNGDDLGSHNRVKDHLLRTDLPLYEVEVTYQGQRPMLDPDIGIHCPVDFDQYAYVLQQAFDYLYDQNHEMVVWFDGSYLPDDVSWVDELQEQLNDSEIVQIGDLARWNKERWPTAFSSYKKQKVLEGRFRTAWAGHLDTLTRVKTFPYLPTGGFDYLMAVAATMDETWDINQLKQLLPNEAYLEDYRIWAEMFYEIVDAQVDYIPCSGEIIQEPKRIRRVKLDFVPDQDCYATRDGYLTWRR